MPHFLRNFCTKYNYEEEQKISTFMGIVMKYKDSIMFENGNERASKEYDLLGVNF